MRFLSCFSGIGGIDCGLEWAGWTCVGQIETDPYCRNILQRHWPHVPKRGDIRLVDGETVRAMYGRVDAIVGGVPCQPVSVAGKRQGSADSRWLWPDFLRLVREVAPRYVLAENVPGLVGLQPHGADWVLDELEAAGYETMPPIIVGARHVGAPHRRDRVWIVARRMDDATSGGDERSGVPQGPFQQLVGGSAARLADTGRGRSDGWALGARAELEHAACEGLEGARQGLSRSGSDRVADAYCAGVGDADEHAAGTSGATTPARRGRAEGLADRDGTGCGEQRSEGVSRDPYPQRRDDVVRRDLWPARPGEPQHDWEAPRTTQSGVGHAVNGIPGRVAGRKYREALKALGNAVVPAVAEQIGRAILAVEQAQVAA